MTQSQWEAVMGNNPSKNKGGDKPGERVSWYNAVAYCNALSEREGMEKCYELRGQEGVPGQEGYKIGEVVFKGLERRGYRLPTEAEWEYACRAGSKGERYGELDKVAWYRRNSGGKSKSVGLKESNAWGLHDMLGTCGNGVGIGTLELLQFISKADPVGPKSGHSRVVRGGSFVSGAVYVRAANRGHFAPGGADAGLGFRCARPFH